MNKKIFLLLSIITSFLIINCTNDNLLNPTPSENDTTVIDTSIIDTSISKKIIIATTDYTDGAISIYNSKTNTVNKDVLSIDSDNKIVTNSGDLYIIERGNGKILKINGTNISENGYIWELSTGAKSNPHDIIFSSATKAYVPLYGLDYMLVINPITGDSIRAISLLNFVVYAGTDSAETTPKMSSGLIENGKLYIICQKLKAHSSVVPAVLVVIDIDADTILTSITLQSKNTSDIKAFDGKLYVSSAGSWNDATDGALEVVDLSNNTSTILLTESDFGGNISSFVIYSNTNAYMSVAMADWKKSVIPFNLSVKTIGTKIDSIGNAGTIFLLNDTLYVGDRDSQNGGLSLFDVSDNSKILGTLSTGLLPNSLAILK